MADTALPSTVTRLSAPPKQRYFWQDALSYLVRDRLTMLSLIGLIILTHGCLIGPVIIENVPYRHQPPITDRYTPPGPEHLLGTDNLGRDSSTLIYGGRISLGIAYFTSALGAIGVALGMIAGFYGDWVDGVLIWFINRG